MMLLSVATSSRPSCRETRGKHGCTTVACGGA